MQDEESEGDEEGDVVEEEGDEYENEEYICDEEDDVPAPTMWTKKEIQDFKSAIKSEGGDSVLSVSQTVSVYFLHLFIFAIQSNPVFWNRLIIFGALPWPNR